MLTFAGVSPAEGGKGLAALLPHADQVARAGAAFALVFGSTLVDNVATGVSRRLGLGDKANADEQPQPQPNGDAHRRPSDDPWYQALKKPSFHPPPWVFPAVWLPLKALQTASLYVLWCDGGKSELVLPTALFSVHLGLGSLWNALFFRKHKIGKSLVAMGCFYATLAGSVASFYSVSKLAAALLAPTQVWVTIAALINVRIWQLNPESDADASGREAGGGGKRRKKK